MDGVIEFRESQDLPEYLASLEDVVKTDAKERREEEVAREQAVFLDYRDTLECRDNPERRERRFAITLASLLTCTC